MNWCLPRIFTLLPSDEETEAGAEAETEEAEDKADVTMAFRSTDTTPMAINSIAHAFIVPQVAYSSCNANNALPSFSQLNTKSASSSNSEVLHANLHFDDLMR